MHNFKPDISSTFNEPWYLDPLGRERGRLGSELLAPVRIAGSELWDMYSEPTDSWALRSLGFRG